MPIAKDCTSLSLGLKSNSLFSNYLDNYWKHLCVFLLNSVNSTLQKVSLYRILSIILGMRVPHLLLKLRGYQIYQWMNLNMVGIDNHGRTAEIAHIESGLALLDEVFHFFPLKVKEDQIFRREFHIRRDEGIHVAYLTVGLLNFADDAFGISTRISFLQELAIHNGIGNCVLTRQIILLGIQSLCKSSQLRGSFEFNDVRSAIRFK